jgi:hypothetical protein
MALGLIAFAVLLQQFGYLAQVDRAVGAAMMWLGQ